MSGFFLNDIDTYFTDIEEAVSRKRGKRYTANALDWNTVEAWKDRGIPIHLILRVIERADKLNSLAYHITDVEKEYEKHLVGKVGAEQTQIATVNCAACLDTGEESYTPDDAEFSWSLKWRACEVCQ